MPETSLHALARQPSSGWRGSLVRRTPRGSWKIAYADLVTALMAFFLVMWIVDSADPSEREEVARYFTGMEPTAPAVTRIAAEDAQDTPNSVLARFEAAPELRAWSSHLRFEASATELRVDLVDLDDAAMFALGSADLSPQAARLIAALAPIIAGTDVRIEIEGHTDSRPTRGERSNWELGADRAEAARLALVAAGLPADRIVAISGRADTLPLEGAAPEQDANRRIRLIFLL